MAQPRFQVPCRTTVATECMKIYVAELEKLKMFFTKFSQRVCLTTDTWTSCQNLNYMCLTAHFIDDDWRLQKRVLNFCLITSHKGIDIGKAVKRCLLEWGISKVLTITVDNASSNDVGITYLKSCFASWKGSVLKGDHLHMRCCAHILSLIVKEGLKDMDDSIFRIRSAVRYVRSSPARLQRFKECVVKEKIESKSQLVLDVETRWNSTYLMLEAAIKFQKAFQLLEIDDSKYTYELSNGERSRGVPSNTDWEYARYILPFLKIFYDATLRASGSLYITSNIYMQEIFGIGVQIIEWCSSPDPSLHAMAIRMKEKFDKYWSNIENINIMLFIATVLDPRHKLEFVEWVIVDAYDSVVADRLRVKVKTVLVGLFEEYNLLKMAPCPTVHSSPSDQLELTNEANIHDVIFDSSAILQNRYKGKKAEKQSLHKTELEKYLTDDCEDENDKSFSILPWWKINSIRYPVMSMIARDVLAMHVSTVASESTFSTGGRILDPFRSSLSPKMVEALICAQDWIRASHVPFSTEESLEELAKFEKEFTFLRLENTCAPFDN